MSAPLVVNTKDGTVWTRREGSRGGEALYAPEKCADCPQFVMATLTELAAHGIAGSADVLPVPVGPERQPLALPWAHAMSDDDLHGFLGDLVSAAMGRWQSAPEVPDRTVLANVEKACAEWRTPGQGYRSDESEVDALLARVAELEAERHTTNEALSDAAEQLRADRDRIAELEQQLAAKDRPADEDPIAFSLTAEASCGRALATGNACSEHTRAEDAMPRVRGLRELVAGQRAAALEDPHDSPLHHDYRVPRDLPEVQR